MKKNVFTGLSFWTILLTNGISIYLAIAENWSVLTVMWVYWLESIILGFYHVLYLWRSNEYPEVISKEANSNYFIDWKKEAINSFCLIFGFLNFVYLCFLLAFTFSDNIMIKNFFGSVDAKYLFIPIIIFLVIKTVSFFRKKEEYEPELLMLRIVPMHITLILGVIFARRMVVLFMVLKMLIDILVQRVENNKSEETVVKNLKKSRTISK